MRAGAHKLLAGSEKALRFLRREDMSRTNPAFSYDTANEQVLRRLCREKDALIEGLVAAALWLVGLMLSERPRKPKEFMGTCFINRNVEISEACKYAERAIAAAEGKDV